MQLLNVIHTGLVNGRVIPYMGPGVLNLGDAPSPLPVAGSVLVTKLTAKASVPHKIRNNLTAAAQFIENFKHRKSVVASMKEAFSPPMAPTVLHRYLASLPRLPLWVHTWYDNLPQQALKELGRPWGTVQGVSQSEHFGQWVHYFDADGSRRADLDSSSLEGVWPTLLYQPLGSVSPAANFLVSDSDFVEVLTEIDIQTPIPRIVQQLRNGRSFLFLGCRFNTQLERIFAQQIIKRSADKHYAVLPEPPTKNESRFLHLHRIQRIDTPLKEWVAALVTLQQSAAAQRLAVN
ncbi:MAG: SIR2 family NAD-dependent protein deacylase [Steroidobacteraceae bacterium]